MTDSAPDPALQAEVERQKAILLRGQVDLVTDEEFTHKLTRSLRDRRPLRVKLGVDPTSSMLHLGFTVVLNKLRAFQDLGHQAVLIIGDATALVGDPTGRNKTRPRLDPEEVNRNAEGYLAQAGKVIDVARAEIRRNSEWLARLDFLGMIGLAARTTVARMLEREDFATRYQGGIPIHVHELLYPLLQGWDSVNVGADVELGGTDQLFNLLVGRDLQEQEGQEPQVCLTTPLLIGLDGAVKMSKSAGNTVGISEPPEDMMVKIMRLDDQLMRDWFLLATRVPVAEIDRLLAPGRNPRDAKLDLGRAIISMYHGDAAARQAAESWLRVVSAKELPADLAEVDVSEVPRGPRGGLGIVDLLMATGWFTSKGEARRMIAQGAVTLGEARVADIAAEVHPSGGAILRCGKQKVAKIRTG